MAMKVTGEGDVLQQFLTVLYHLKGKGREKIQSRTTNRKRARGEK